MAEKDSMLNTANAYVRKVRAAASACEEVQEKIKSEIAVIEENWSGDSGSAMVTKLQSIVTDLGTVAQLLSSASASMKLEAQSIYDSWPEEINEEEGDVDG